MLDRRCPKPRVGPTDSPPEAHVSASPVAPVPGDLHLFKISLCAVFLPSSFSSLPLLLSSSTLLSAPVAGHREVSIGSAHTPSRSPFFLLDPLSWRQDLATV
ncbi:uncharacterized protein LDX57_002072 [Aspergillus melleus]|uniref:uncharacterized protein n=1 Tax=Aspergillus melleus TaxID=138277 RepID=UPI001E8E5BA8|nr:uncharacterized protein LDX57_002072 [Aspergillus melleus]KAH8424321.1 hypothetical protein LDX57_002072 [Aspergillus melleus]